MLQREHCRSPFTDTYLTRIRTLSPKHVEAMEGFLTERRNGGHAIALTQSNYVVEFREVGRSSLVKSEGAGHLWGQPGE